MGLDEVAARGLVLLGCGKMGSALLRGWIAGGLPATSVHVREPHPSEWLAGLGVALNDALPASPAVAFVAVKPQMMGEALPAMTALGGGATLVLSIAAGTSIAAFEAAFGPATPIIRAMPNTPAAIGRGITAIVGSSAATEDHLNLAEELLSAVGEVVRLDREAQIDAVTGLSGSGPAYVFHLIEALAQAGEAEGLAPELALRLARTTVAGSGALAMETGTDPAQLRRDVTSPNGTTQAGLAVLMDEGTGLPPLIRRTVRAAVARAEELGRT